MLYGTLYHSFTKQGILFKQIVSETPKELRYIERSVFMKDADHQNLGTLELGSQQKIMVPMWTNVGFQQKNRGDSQKQNKDTFCRQHVTSAQCIIGMEKDTNACILLNYDENFCFWGYGRIEELLEMMTSLNHIYLTKILDPLMKIMMLVIIYMLSI